MGRLISHGMAFTRTRKKDNRTFSQYSIAIPSELDRIILKLAVNGKSKTKVLAEIVERVLRKKK